MSTPNLGLKRKLAEYFKIYNMIKIVNTFIKYKIRLSEAG